MTDLESMVLKALSGSVLTITLNRPDKSNSLHPNLVAQLSEVLAEAGDSDSVNVVVLTGSGNSFCAGLDLELLLQWSAGEKLSYLEKVVWVFRKVWTLKQPVIAAVNGAAIAGGFDLAAFCDIRLAAREALFGQAEINLALTQIIHPLYKSIGLARAKEMAMTGQNISAEEAYRIGLVNHVYQRDELMQRAMEMAAVLASKPRHALFETKRLTRVLVDLDTDAALEEIGKSFRGCVTSDEHPKRVAALYERIKKKS